MRPTPRQWMVGALVALVVATGAAWLVRATEWDTRQVREPPKGEAAADPHFLLKQWATRLEAHIQTRHQLDTMPPEGATLLLESSFWHFLPEREPALRAWVERGGHLVVFQQVGDDRSLSDWVPLRFKSPPRPPKAAQAASAASAAAGDDEQEDEPEDEDEDDADRPAATLSEVRLGSRCPGISEPAGRPGWFGEPRRYDVCHGGARFLKPGVKPLWSVEGALGPQAARVAVGQGTVTMSTRYMPPRGPGLLGEDEAALMAALLQLRPGQQIWLVDDEEHPGLLALLWRLAPAAWLAAGIALALVLWRWSVRFAPLRAATDLSRRSMAEQVRGTSAYLLRHGPSALHRAQWRALDETAERHLPGWRRLAPGQRLAWLARLADLPLGELEQACADDAPADRPAAAGRALAVMETTRRRIAGLGAHALAASRPPLPPDRTEP